MKAAALSNVFLLLVLICWAPAVFADQLFADLPDISDDTRLVRLSGDAYQRGLEHGKLLKSEIRDLIAIVDMEYLDSWWRRLWGRYKASNMEPFFPDELKAEMQGIADGAGLDYKAILVGNVMSDLNQLMGQPLACSTFIVFPGRSATGGMLFGRNLDWHRRIGSTLRRVIRPFLHAVAGRRQILSIAIPGMVGVLTGINDAGVMIALNYSEHDDMTSEGIPVSILYRKVLARAGNWDEAVSIIRSNVPRTIAVNTTLADGVKAGVLEMTSTKTAVRETNGDGLLYATNHFESEELGVKGIRPRDYRWPHLYAWQRRGITRPLNLVDLRSTISGSAMNDEYWANVKAVLMDYARGDLYYGTGYPPVASSPLSRIDLRKAFNSGRYALKN